MSRPIRRKTRPRPRRRQQAVDRLGDRAAPRGRGCARSRSPTRASASRKPCAASPSPSRARSSRACDVRSDDDVERVFARGRRDLRRGARPARPLRRLRGRGRSRGALHRHAARPLLARARRELRLLPRRGRPRCRAADGGGRRRLDPDDDLPRRRASRAALQRHGRREVGARRVGSLPRLGSRAEEHPRERDLGRADADARRPLDPQASRRWRRSSRSAPRSTARSTTRRRRRGGRLPPLGRRGERHRRRRSTSTPATTPWACRALDPLGVPLATPAVPASPRRLPRTASGGGTAPGRRGDGAPPRAARR